MPETQLQIPDAVSAELDHLELTVEGPNGSVTRRLWYPDVSVTVESGEVVITSESDDAIPMQVTIEDGEVVISNFLGERADRRTAIHGNTDVEIDGELLTLRGPDIEAVGQTAADIEQLTRVTDKDIRVFQDGAYITNKPTRGDA